MTTHCFTSISFSYLNRSRVLGESIKKFHPDWVSWLLISDEPPAELKFDIHDEPWDRVFFSKDLEIDNISGWIFKHDVVELCTAVKGRFVEKLLDGGAEKVFYLDPDIALFNSLNPLSYQLDVDSVLLTPHQLGYVSEHLSIMDNEVASLIHGTYNLGFLAIRNDSSGLECARWWSHRLENYCYDDKPRGLFVDQKWCDLIPAYFENVGIVRDPGYNVASWNLNSRRISSGSGGSFYVNDDYPLRFYHFTKLGPIGDSMTRRYAGENIEVYEIWAWYKRAVLSATDPIIPERYWHYGKYSSGNEIPKTAREVYRHRVDVREAFPDPFDSTHGGYEAWYEAEVR